MESEYYERRTDRGILTISPSKVRLGRWDLRLDGRLIRSDYTDPNQVALDASNHDFGIAEFDELFQHVYVPSDLRDWRTSSHVYRRDSKPI